MAKIEANKLELSSIEYHFEQMIQKILTVIQFRSDEKQQKLIVNIDEKIPTYVVGDDQRLSQVITNLLSNAVKFTPDGGEVSLNIFLNEDTKDSDKCELRVTVIDNGIGVSPEQQGKLFDAFEQAERGTSRKYGGTGLGLAISKRIIELMGGEIKVESQLGKGTKFTFTAQIEQGNKLDALTEQDVTDDSIESVFEGKRLLMVEDVEINRVILLSFLEGTGLIIDCAVNGIEAVDKVTQNLGVYDIVLMDLRMPLMDGFEATKRIRALPDCDGEKLPIIAITANAFKEDIDACMAAGMNGHLAKPFDFDKIIKVLRKYL